MTFDEFMTNEDELYLRITKKSYLYNRNVIKQYLYEPHVDEIDEFFKFKPDNSIAYLRNNKLMERVRHVGAIATPAQVDSILRTIDCLDVAFNAPNVENSTDESEVIVILLNNDTMVMDSVHCIFRYKAYAEYALNHNFNVKFMQTTSTDSVKIIKHFVDKGFGIEFGVDKEITPDRVCTIDKIYVKFINPKQVKSND